MSYVFFTIKSWDIQFFESAHILPNFVLKIYHNFKSYQNMLTLPIYFLNVISYKFLLNNIYIVSYLHVKKIHKLVLKPLFFINTKLKKYENFSAF